MAQRVKVEDEPVTVSMVPRRLAVATALSLALFVALTVRAAAEVGSTLLFDMTSGEVIAAHEPTAPWYPASITKLMTAYVTFAALRDGELTPSSPVKISVQARQQPPSRMGFALGTVITVETALRIILTKSANDVSVALAEAVGGTQKKFIDRMNAAAAKLGMVSTRYDNPHGLPNRGQVTTARDIALLMMALHDEFADRADYFAMPGVRLGGKTLINHNVLIRRFDGATGMKTGFICASGFNLAATAKRGEVHLGAVVLGGLTSRERDHRTAELLEKGFEAVATGGIVELDGFGDTASAHVHRPVAGVRAPLGTVEALTPRPGAAAAELRDVVCGASRPVTRYDAGTVGSRAAFEAQMAAWRTWSAAREARIRSRRELLSAPRTVRAQLPRATGRAAPARRLAEASLIPAGWTSSWSLASPARHPLRPLAEGSDAPVEEAVGDPVEPLAPEDWVPSPSVPAANPLVRAGIRAPLPAEPAKLALSYLGPPRAAAPVVIAIGGADQQRPRALSGPLLGGGRAPLPRAKPEPAVPAEIETETVADAG